MKVTWGFIIDGTYRYGMESFTYDSNTYTAKIVPDSFSGITMRVDMISKLYAPNEAEFSISNGDGALSESDFQDKRVCLFVLLNNVLARIWCLSIKTASESYGAIHCVCTDHVEHKLKGTFPNTPTLASNFPSDQITEDPEYVVPITLGTAFIPCMPFLYSGVNYYCLGKTISSYTVIKLRSPRSYDFKSEWDNSYSYPQANYTGEQISVRGIQAIIADSDGDGTVDANGIWNPRGTMLPPLVNFTGPYPTITGPGGWIYYVLQLMGVSSTYLDLASFNAVDSALSAVTWGGGWWKPEEKEAILSSLLSQCDCYLTVEDTVSLHLFSTTSVETFDRSNIISDSFSAPRSEKPTVDGAKLKFVWDGEPQDILSGEATVPLYGAQASIDNPSNEVFEYKFGYDNAEAQKFAILWAQKKFDQKYPVRFSTDLSILSSYATIAPGQVATVYGISETGVDVYGDSKDFIITSMHIKPDLETDIAGMVYNHLEEYADLNPTAIVPDESLNADFDFFSLAKFVKVSGANIFHFLAGATLPEITSINLTASLFGGLTTYDWEYWNGSSWVNLSGTQNASTYNLTYNNTAWTTVGENTLRVRCVSGDYSDEITITKVYDGEDGEDGADGAAGATGPGLIYVGEYGVNWTWPKVFYNNENRRDVIKYSGTYYIYNSVDGLNNTVWQSPRWETFGATFSSVATDLLLAQDVAITRSLTFSGGASYLNITGTDGLIINASGGLTVNSANGVIIENGAGIRVSQGADIYFASDTGNPSQAIFAGASRLYRMGVAVENDYWVTYPNTAGYGGYYFGVNWGGTIVRPRYFYAYASQVLRMDSSLYIYLSGGTFIDIDTPYLRGSGYPNIGSSTTAYKFGYGYFVYDLSCRALVLTSSITGATNITASGTISGNQLTCTGGSYNFTLYEYTTHTTFGTPRGTIWVNIGGSPYRIAVY